MENSALTNNRLPFGNTKLVLGIASIVFSPILIGFILGSVSLYLVDKDKKMFNEYPDNYDKEAISNHKLGSIFSFIGFIVSIVVAAIIIYYYYTYGTLDISIINDIKATS